MNSSSDWYMWLGKTRPTYKRRVWSLVRATFFFLWNSAVAWILASANSFQNQPSLKAFLLGGTLLVAFLNAVIVVSCAWVLNRWGTAIALPWVISSAREHAQVYLDPESTSIYRPDIPRPELIPAMERVLARLQPDGKVCQWTAYRLISRMAP